MVIICTILLDISLPGIRSLKEKRNILKPLLYKLRKHFNISASEIDHQDNRQLSTIMCAQVSNDGKFSHSQCMKIVNYVENSFPQIMILNYEIGFR